MSATDNKTALLDSLRSASASMGEHNDCTVLALAAAGGVSYADAHAALKRHGRRDRKGPAAIWRTVGNERTVACPAIEKAATDLGLRWTLIPGSQIRAKTMTTAPRDPKLRTGRYIAMVRGHAAAIVDGDVVDWTDGRKHRIKSVYEFTRPAVAPTPAPQPQPKAMKRMSGFQQGRLF